MKPDHNHQKKIAVINDFSGFGRCSIAVALPIISAMRIQCCPVPTAILSNHTEFPSFTFDDFTPKLAGYTDEWVSLGLTFDGIVTGFLSSAEQISVVAGIIGKLKTEKTEVIVDPVLGDGGKLYPTCTKELCEEMKTLVGMADITLPNVTEACLLTGTPYKERGWTRKELTDMAVKLRLMGAKSVVVTGVREGVFIANAVLARGSAEAAFIRTKRTGQTRPGTGDVCSSVLAGAVLNGETLTGAARLAAGFVRDCIACSDELGIPLLNGVCFERLLWKLAKR